MLERLRPFRCQRKHRLILAGREVAIAAAGDQPVQEVGDDVLLAARRYGRRMFAGQPRSRELGLEEVTGARASRMPARFVRGSKPKVDDPHTAIWRDEHIPGMNIAVKYAATVDLGIRARHRTAQFEQGASSRDGRQASQTRCHRVEVFAVAPLDRQCGGIFELRKESGRSVSVEETQNLGFVRQRIRGLQST
jgi:hypothetical protein